MPSIQSAVSHELCDPYSCYSPILPYFVYHLDDFKPKSIDSSKPAKLKVVQDGVEVAIPSIQVGVSRESLTRPLGRVSRAINLSQLLSTHRPSLRKMSLYFVAVLRLAPKNVYSLSTSKRGLVCRRLCAPP